MKKLVISIMCIFCAFGAYAENEPAATSREYVDAGVAEKQPTVPAAGANVVMTFDSTATNGIGTKGVYDATGDYASQQNALVTAATANAAVQMAINGEFVCHEWNPDNSNDCWLWKIKEPVAQSRNLFDISKIKTRTVDNGTGTVLNNDDGSITVTANPTNSAIAVGRLSALAPDLVPGSTYVLSSDTTGTTKTALIYCSASDRTSWAFNTSKLITENLLDCLMYFYASGVGTTATISNIQIEEGTVATPYQPYGQNTFIPQNVQ